MPSSHLIDPPPLALPPPPGVWLEKTKRSQMMRRPRPSMSRRFPVLRLFFVLLQLERAGRGTHRASGVRQKAMKPGPFKPGSGSIRPTKSNAHRSDPARSPRPTCRAPVSQTITKGIAKPTRAQTPNKDGRVAFQTARDCEGLRNGREGNRNGVRRRERARGR